tara:strand:+ start:4247 stop:5005 length:759 start_codon:yes stop_codon:yes gene_type:complete
MKNLAGKVVMVTGGASGLGLAMVQRFLEEGSHVVAADRSRAALDELVTQGSAAVPLDLDVTDPDAVERAIGFVVDKFGALDVLVNNAGVGPKREQLHKSSLDDWRKVMDVNLSGAFYCIKFGVAQMLKQEARGNIVNIVSTGGMVGMAQLPSYAAAKGGLVNLTRAAAVEYGPAGIRVNAVAPTAVVTPMLQSMADLPGDPSDVAQRIAQMNPLHGVVEPDDIAAAVAFLASDDARFISGVILPVDGAYTAQ